jgi:hypothetical protein
MDVHKESVELATADERVITTPRVEKLFKAALSRATGRQKRRGN